MNFYLERKLKEWTDQNIITEKDLSAIKDYEGGGNTSYVFHAVIGLAAVAVVVGIISIIASNWYAIPSGVKLFSNLSWLCFVATAIYLFEQRGNKELREGAILIFFGSILASMALVGQIYHLDSHLFLTISTWLALTFLIVIRAEENYIPYIFTFVLIVYFVSYLDFLNDHIFWKRRNTDRYFFNLPLGLLFLSQIFELVLKKTNFKFALQNIGWLITIFVSIALGSHRWERDLTETIGVYGSIPFFLLLATSFFFYKERKPHKVVFLSLAFLFTEIPHWFSHSNLEVIGAIFFILSWATVAALAVKQNMRRLFDFSCIAIAIRLIIIYFEVFGSLLQTGVGLLSSGIVTLILAVAWHKKRHNIWNIFGGGPHEK